MSRVDSETAGRFVALLRELEDSGAEVSVRTDYSGRAMYGRSCVGVETDALTPYGVALALVELCDGDEEDLAAIVEVGEPRTDSMGLGTILYWPGVEAPADEESAEVAS